MGATGALMAMQLFSAKQQSQAQEAQGDYTRQQMETNADLAEMNAADTIKRGDQAANVKKTQAKGVVGAQRAALAAQGLDLSDGSAAEIQAETAELGELDAMSIKNDAWRQAWGYRVEASNSRAGGQWAQMAGRNSARNTMLAGGISAFQTGLSGYKPKDKLMKDDAPRTYTAATRFGSNAKNEPV
ncbi:MAG: hypothetical protein H0X02_04580 [Nitrosomonas sp.]|nr:hypothetical protein [Nitrosomonas sp.]